MVDLDRPGRWPFRGVFQGLLGPPGGQGQGSSYSQGEVGQEVGVLPRRDRGRRITVTPAVGGRSGLRKPAALPSFGQGGLVRAAGPPERRPGPGTFSRLARGVADGETRGCPVPASRPCEVHLSCVSSPAGRRWTLREGRRRRPAAWPGFTPLRSENPDRRGKQYVLAGKLFGMVRPHLLDASTHLPVKTLM